MIGYVGVETINKASECVVVSTLSCVVCLVINYVETYALCEASPFVVVEVRGGCYPIG